jgi:DNA integrity scanning protein DisA with diadenylate cyclase activity
LRFIKNDNISKRKILAAKLSEIAFELSSQKIGALITIEQKDELSPYYNQNAIIDAELSGLLCLTIFQKNSPLHDGSIIIRNFRL